MITNFDHGQIFLGAKAENRTAGAGDGNGCVCACVVVGQGQDQGQNQTENPAPAPSLKCAGLLESDVRKVGRWLVPEPVGRPGERPGA